MDPRIGGPPAAGRRADAWILNLVAKLLLNDPPVVGLIGENPFPDQPPTHIRAELYEYHFTKTDDTSGNWWTRRRVATYLPPLSLKDSKFVGVLKQQGWLDRDWAPPSYGSK